MDRWELLRDIGTWGAGLVLIFFEASRPMPNEYVLGAAVLLIAPRVARQVKVLSGHTGGPSSPSSPPPPSPALPGPGGTDERPAG